ncbi:MAG TPA: DUF72 domain-containing protein [Blastocatellia bacterium]|nr:DUF72 domain-containing protein [Blastocatellia bacterium]
MKQRGRIRIGCSGWIYKHWRGDFYPQELKQSQWFDFYASQFDTVEINNTFYRLPAAKTFEGWEVQAPDDFLYAVKASRYITHMKKLKDAKEPLRRFLDRARLLKKHLGPILYQLPSRWHLNLERLESFLDLLPPDLLHVFEFRDESWMQEEVFRLLDGRGVSFCTHDMQMLDVPRRAAGPVAYVRFHGPQERYKGRYPGPALDSWWRWMEEQVRDGRDLYVYFNNDAHAHAPRDARRLAQRAGLIGG